MKLSQCVLVAAALLVLCGCGPENGHDDHDDHHHHHGSDTPHGGHLIKLEPSDLTAEWTHDDKAGKVTIYILDSEGKKDAPIATDVVKITGDKPVAFEYPLIAVDPTEDDPPEASKFENSTPSPKLLTAAKAGEAVGAKLEFDVDGKRYVGAIEHDHDH